MGQHTPVVEPPLECTPSETPPWPDNRGSEIRKIMKIQVLNGKSGVSYRDSILVYFIVIVSNLLNATSSTQLLYLSHLSSNNVVF